MVRPNLQAATDAFPSAIPWTSRVVVRGLTITARARVFNRARRTSAERPALSLESRREQAAHPDAEQAQHDREADVRAGPRPLALLCEVQRLQAEGGEGREASEDAGHPEVARHGARRRAAVR